MLQGALVYSCSGCPIVSRVQIAHPLGGFVLILCSSAIMAERHAPSQGKYFLVLFVARSDLFNSSPQ